MRDRVIGLIQAVAIYTTIFILNMSCGGTNPDSRAADVSGSLSAPASGVLFFGGEAPVYVGGPFEVLGESVSHHYSSKVYVGQPSGSSGQPVIHTRTAVAYGSIVRDYTLYLESGTIAFTQNDDHHGPTNNTITLPPPSRGGNYFEYTKALAEMVGVVEKVRGGSNVVPHRVAPMPELDDTIRYLRFIAASLTDSSLEAVFLDVPSNVKASGSYEIGVSYKTKEPRGIILTLQCDENVVASAQGQTQSGIGKTSVKVDLPDDLPAQCHQAQFEVKLGDLSQHPLYAVAKYSRQVDLAVSNVIENIYTRASTDLRDKACWFRLIYAIKKEATLKVALVNKGSPGDVVTEQQYTLAPGDEKAQDVLFMLPEQGSSNFTGTQKLHISILAKDGKILADYELYVANARA